MPEPGIALPGLARQLALRCITRHEFAVRAGVGPSIVYRAVAGGPVSHRAARLMAEALAQIPLPTGLDALTERAG